MSAILFVAAGTARGEGMEETVLSTKESAYREKGDVIKPKNVIHQNFLCSFEPYILVLGSTKFTVHSTN